MNTERHFVHNVDWRDKPEQSLLVRTDRPRNYRRRVLKGISRRDREILNRFYVQEPMAKICDEMGLSYNQFRLLKSRAKARFGELGKRMALGMGMTRKL